MEAHIPRDTLENLKTFEKIIDELSVLWKINRVDLDLLEHLLRRIGLLERFAPELEKFKSTVGYEDLSASSEREVTTIISSLHNLLQGEIKKYSQHYKFKFSFLATIAQGHYCL